VALAAEAPSGPCGFPRNAASFVISSLGSTAWVGGGRGPSAPFAEADAHLRAVVALAARLRARGRWALCRCRLGAATAPVKRAREGAPEHRKSFEVAGLSGSLALALPEPWRTCLRSHPPHLTLPGRPDDFDGLQPFRFPRPKCGRGSLLLQVYVHGDDGLHLLSRLALTSPCRRIATMRCPCGGGRP